MPRKAGKHYQEVPGSPGREHPPGTIPAALVTAASSGSRMSCLDAEKQEAVRATEAAALGVFAGHSGGSMTNGLQD